MLSVDVLLQAPGLKYDYGPLELTYMIKFQSTGSVKFERDSLYIFRIGNYASPSILRATVSESYNCPTHYYKVFDTRK